jgi:hypothetical protein
MKAYNLYLVRIIRMILVMFFSGFLYGQSETNLEERGVNQLTQTSEFSIPISPAFDLLGVNPSLVPKPGVLRNFKVDWSFKSYGLTPNLALQVQPFNELYFNSPKKLKTYNKRSGLLKMLATLDISAGTIDGNNNVETKQLTFQDIEGNDSIVISENNWRIRSFAYAFKLNLYKQYDPMSNKYIFNRVIKEYDEKKVELKRELSEKRKEINETKDLEEKLAFKEEAKSIEYELNSLEETYLDRMKKIAQLYMEEKWNASHIDIAAGQGLDYDSRDSSLFKFNDLHLVNTRWAVWLNGSLGIGKRVLLSTIVRYNNFTNELLNRKSESIDWGVNFRYGNYRYNFFTEIYLPLNLKNTELLDSKFISIGGDWRFSRNVILNYGMRILVNQQGKLENIVPVVSVSCIMR